MKLKPFIYAGIFISLHLFISCKQEEPQKKNTAINVEVYNTNNKNTNFSAIGYSGTISANTLVTASFQISGTVLNVPVELGTYVTKGTLLATVDATVYQNQYEVQKAQADLAKENYNRILKVYEKGSIAEIKMLDARSKYEQATAAARATYQNIKHANVYAPINGYISDKMIQAGDLAAPGKPAVQIQNITTVKANIPIPDDEINTIKEGDTTTISIPALNGITFSGNIDEIAIASNKGTPIYTAKVTINNKDNKLKPGMVCNVFINSNKTTENVLVIPVQSVLVTENGNNYVFIAKDGKAVRKEVVTGKLYNKGIAIEKGLTSGDKVIITGYHKLTNNTPVTIVN